MALCGICKHEVETHRYVRAEPMRIELVNGREWLAPYQLKVSGFYCLDHPNGAIEAAITRSFPPTRTLPVRLLWSPAPRVRVSRPGLGVIEKRSRDGHHGVRTIVVRDAGELHMALPELVPPGTVWLIPYRNGGTPHYG